MQAIRLETVRKLLEARSFNERALLLATFAALLGWFWLTLVSDPMDAAQNNVRRQIAAVEAQIGEQRARYLEVQESYSEDPNSFARNRLGMLQAEAMEVDRRLNELYGQLISPREMSLVLTSILQRETSLRLVSLENTASESLFEAGPGAGPLVVPGPGSVAAPLEEGQRVYQHGLRMVFEGGFIDTLRFLRSLEELDSNFFWEELSYDVQAYPNARITLRIFTLSSEREWIGV